MQILNGVIAFMISKLMTVLFLSIFIVGAACAVPMCPFDPIEPSEAAQTYAEGSISNGGIVNGLLFLEAFQVTGITGNMTGYTSANKYLVGSGRELAYADTMSTMLDTLKTETGISLNGGRATYGESAMYSYATPNVNGTDDYEPFCEQAMTSAAFSITNGQYASTIDMTNLVSTNVLSHSMAIEGTGMFSASSGYGLMQNTSVMFNGDKLTAIGDMKFAREVIFKSIKS
jgi:hypothetical protein